MIVLHYTAGTSAESSALFLTRPEVSASAHVVIGREGEVFQLVPFNIEAWHAGKSWYAGRGGLNRYSIGIELDNLGELRFAGNLFIAECGRWYRRRRCTRTVPAIADVLASLHGKAGPGVTGDLYPIGRDLPDP